MEADVVVNFINFLTNVEEEDLIAVLNELRLAGLDRNSIDMMIVQSLSGCLRSDQSFNDNPEPD